MRYLQPVQVALLCGLRLAAVDALAAALDDRRVLRLALALILRHVALGDRDCEGCRIRKVTGRDAMRLLCDCDVIGDLIAMRLHPRRGSVAHSKLQS